MTLALYATIWIALALFVAAQASYRAVPPGRVARLAPRLAIAGALLCGAHMLIALGTRYGWSHETAVRDTARQAAAVYGVAWNGSLYVNYLFLAAWAVEAWWWRGRRVHDFSRPPPTIWTLRAFYVLIIANAAIGFARGAARPFGLALLAALLWVWRPGAPVNRRARASVL